MLSYGWAFVGPKEGVIHNKYTALWSMLRNERMAAPALEELREVKLRRLVRHAYEHVPYYRRMFGRCGVSPNEIRAPADLRRLPVIDKCELQIQPIGDLISDRHDSTAELYRLSTAGSTGRPFDVFIDRGQRALRKAQSLRPYLTNGRRLRECCVHFTGFLNRGPKWFERVGLLREHRIDCGASHESQVRVLDDLRPQVIQGYPSALTSLAAYARDRDVRLPTPRLIFTDSELLIPESRRLIEEVFGAPVVDVYGTWETGNIAHECSERRGHHVAIDCVILEVVTPEGDPARDGDEGELVCTVLDNLAMPLIRYRLGDVAAKTTRTCPCGRSFPLLEVIAGRSDDSVRMKDGGTLSAQAFLTSFNFLSGAVREFQIVQEAVDRFRVIVVPGSRFDDAVAEQIRGHIGSRHPDAEVLLTVVDRIERSASGKLRSFRSLVTETGEEA